jgi:hypothetical protein
LFECDVEELADAIEATRVWERTVLSRMPALKRLSEQQSDGRLLDPGDRERHIFDALADCAARLEGAGSSMTASTR